jgi:hypothetical protein
MAGPGQAESGFVDSRSLRQQSSLIFKASASIRSLIIFA